MATRFIRQGTRRADVSLLGLLLALAFLAHDLLMAGDAHHTLAQHRGPSSAHDITAMLAANAPSSAAIPLHLDATVGLYGCGFLRAVIPARDDDSRVAGPEHATVDATTDRVPLSHGLAKATELTAPPRVRRALLQVFRI